MVVALLGVVDAKLEVVESDHHRLVRGPGDVDPDRLGCLANGTRLAVVRRADVAGLDRPQDRRATWRDNPTAAAIPQRVEVLAELVVREFGAIVRQDRAARFGLGAEPRVRPRDRLLEARPVLVVVLPPVLPKLVSGGEAADLVARLETAIEADVVTLPRRELQMVPLVVLDQPVNDVARVIWWVRDHQDPVVGVGRGRPDGLDVVGRDSRFVRLLDDVDDRVVVRALEVVRVPRADALEKPLVVEASPDLPVAVHRPAAEHRRQRASTVQRPGRLPDVGLEGA